MSMERVINTARGLKQPPAGAAGEYESKVEAMAAELNRRMLSRPDLERLIGTENVSMLENNSRNFLRFMGSLFRSFDPSVLVETVSWVFRSYRAHGFQTSFWPANIDTAVEILRESVSKDTYNALYPFFEWLIVNIPSFVSLSDEALKAGPGDAGHE